MRSFLLSLLTAACAVAALRADAPSVSGLVVDPSGLPLPGVSVMLQTGGDADALSAVTDDQGRYEFKAVPPGVYELDATLDGFERATRTNLDVSSNDLHVDMKLALSVVRQDVTVVAQAPPNMLGSAQPNAPVTVTRTVMDVAMLPNSQFDDVLPLMPNVVRGPDGLISVGGARAESGGLFVDGISAANPISGGPGLMLPLEAVETMQVYAGGAPAQYTGATGGITAVTTRSGSERFHLSLDSFFPRLLYTDSGISGIAFWDPNLGFGGPVGSGGHATFQQAVSYRYDRNTYTTLKGDDQNVFNALYSWTQVDTRVGDRQRVRTSVGADPRVTDRANITAFTPSDSAPRVNQGGWTLRLSDSITAGRALVEFQTATLQTRADVQPHGSEPYVVTHQLASGSYFDTQLRHATVNSAGVRVSWSPAGGSLITAGASVNRSQLNQSVDATVVDMMRSDGSLARRIASVIPGQGAVGSTVMGLFVEGRVAPRQWLTLDAGVRLDETTNAGDPPPAPRFGWTLSRDQGRTTLSGSAGLFADVMPLGALAFTALPNRQMVVMSPDGAVATTRDYMFASDLHLPRAARWDLEFNRRSGPWLVRVRYEERRASQELIVQPRAAEPGADGDIEHVVLSSTGSSRARSLETTAGLRRSGGEELYVSYVHAATWGDQNSLDVTEGLLRPTFEQVNLRGPLPADVPSRVLAWGLFHLPGRFTVAPFLDTRNGFPYTAIDDDWLVAELPGAHRLPWMTSLDLSATRIIGLPRHLPEARVGIKLYNIVSVNTEREVQRDIERADFGTRYDPVPRDFSVVLEFLWGKSQRPRERVPN